MGKAEAVLVGLLLAAPLVGQQGALPPPPPMSAALEEAQQQVEAGPAGQGLSPVALEERCAQIPDAETQALCWHAFRERLHYYERGLEHRARVLAWQHLCTQIIFVVVLFLVAVGVVFAWLQFHQGLKRASRGGSQEAQPEHEIEISTKGIKVSSPVLGVIILALSLGFFYLYLVFAYPITEVF